MVARKHRPTTGHASPNAGLDDEIHDFYKKILRSNRLQADEKREIELIARLQAQEMSRVEMAREIAAKQARRTYKCEGCALEFLGILAFAEHDEETSHMANRGKKVLVRGQL